MAFRRMAALQELRLKRDQLSCLLEQLDSLASEVQHGPESQKVKARLDDVEKTNKELMDRNTSLEATLSRNNEETVIKIGELEYRNMKLLDDVERITTENRNIMALADKRDSDNETISNVLEKVCCDYEDLQKAFESQKCPKDDKIKALRNTVKALQAENELLQEEKAIKARDNINIHNNLLKKLTKMEETCQTQKVNIVQLENENKIFNERYKRLEDEKINVLREMTKVERAFESCEDKLQLLKQGKS